MWTGNSVFREGVRTARAARPLALYLSFLGMAIPLTVFRLVSARWSLLKANEIQNIDLTSGQAMPLFQAVGNYASSYLGAGLLCALCVGWAYLFAIDTFATEFGQAGAKPPLRRLPGHLLRLCASAPLLFVTLALLGAVAQVLPFVAIMISILWLMVPVVMLLDGKGTVRALRESLLLRYAPAAAGRRQFAFFRLMSLGFGVYAALMAVVLMGEDFLKLDQIVPITRSVWLKTIPWLDLPLGFTLHGLLTSMLEAACLMSLALFTVSLYVAVRAPAKSS